MPRVLNSFKNLYAAPSSRQLNFGIAWTQVNDDGIPLFCLLGDPVAKKRNANPRVIPLTEASLSWRWTRVVTVADDDDDHHHHHFDDNDDDDAEER